MFQKKLTLIKQVHRKDCDICHYWYFKDVGFKYAPYGCNVCHDTLLMAYDLKSIAILNVKDVDYRCVLRNMSKNDAINRLNNSKLDDKRRCIWRNL